MVQTRSPRKRTRLDYDERRALILDAARHQFCERPYSDVSMSDLAEGAGVARGLLHHYFGSKRDLYLAVVRDMVQLPTLPLPDSLSATDDVIGVWELSVDGWMNMVEANQDLWFTVIGAGGMGRDPELAEILDQSRELTAQRCLEALGIRRDDMTDTVRAMVRAYGAMAEEATREWLERGRLSRDETRELLRQALPLMIEQALPGMQAASPRS